jgi:DNA-binding SARP family transcriptional activator/tetratricopeptide (TPR) repeat protein
VRILLLGPVQAERAGRPVPLGPPQHRLIVAILALEANRLVPVDRLVELVWPTSPPRSAAHAVQVAVSRLRGRLADAAIEVVRQGPGYALRVDPDKIDVHRFATLVDLARQTDDDTRRVSLLDQALALWTGPALSGTAATDQVRHRLCSGLEESRLTAVEARIDARLRLDEHRDLLGELAALVGEHPLRERLVGQLMRALYRCGRSGEALQAYRRIRELIADELGIDPSAELRQLELAILRGDPALDPVPRTDAAVAFPAGYTASTEPAGAVPAQLPPAVPGFAGRARELARLDQLLASRAPDRVAVAITSIDGTAGVGKTTLAVYWAHRVADRFPDGQLYVNLRGFGPDGTAVEPTDAVRGFLDALGVPVHRVPTELGAQTALYRSLLFGRRMLVVLDNARDADQVRPLLPGAPGCLVLVTSRNQLASLVAVEGAQPLTLGVLTDAEAFELLAGRLGTDRLAAERQPVDEIVTRSARLPLALAIVAARVATRPGFPLYAIAAELRDRHPRLDVLTGGDETADMRAVFSWSYQALTDPAARLFRLLGIHPGPDITVAAAASLAAVPEPQVRPLLGQLAAGHLIAEHAPGRFGLHDLLRIYAAEQAAANVAERGEARRRMLDHYLHTARTAASRLDQNRDPITLPAAAPGVSPEDLADLAEATGWFRAEYPVLIAVIELAADAGLDVHVWQLAWTLMDYFNRSGRWLDQADTFRSAVEAAGRLGDQPAEGYARRILARALGRLQRYDDAHQQLQVALELFAALRDPVGEAHTHLGLSWILAQQGRCAEALGQDRRALALFEAERHLVGQARALNNIGWWLTQRGDYLAALEHSERALELCHRLGDRYDEALTLNCIGYAHGGLGDHRRAALCQQHAVRLYREVNHLDGEAEALTHLGDTHFRAGDLGAAREAWRRALDILDLLGHPNAERVRARLPAEVPRNRPSRSA